MVSRNIFRLPALIFFFLLISTAAGTEELPTFNSSLPPDVLAREITVAMNDKELLGQILMFGYPEEKPDPVLIDWIKNNGLGSVKIFGRNAASADTLAETIGIYQEASLENRFHIPLIIATDQEGGWVRHVKGPTSITPGNMALGADRLPSDAYKTGEIIGRELADLGINMNLAPVVDVYVDPRADVIGPRAFMSDPEWSGILGLAFAKGQQEAGIISTAKHFPGHGDTETDSHGKLPVVNADLETIKNRDLVPYRILIKGSIPSIMVGHLAYPSITGTKTPASLSRFFMTELLRNEMGFKGVIITDDLIMRGARSNGLDMNEVCMKSVKAGADILMISENHRIYSSIYSYMLSEMKADPQFRETVRKAAERVIKLKADFLKGPDAVPLKPDVKDISDVSRHSENFFLQQAARSITLVKDYKFPLPENKAGKVLLAGCFNDFFTEGLKRYPEAKTWKLIYEPTKAGLRERGRELLRAAKNYDTLIITLPDEEMTYLINELEPAADKVIVISVHSPAHLDQIPWVKTAIAAYGTGTDSFKAAFAALSGDFTPQGKLPIPLDITQ